MNGNDKNRRDPEEFKVRRNQYNPLDGEDWREWDRERYGNDDYRRFAGPDFTETGYPGASRKPRRGGYQRSDDRIYEEVCVTLRRSPDVDTTHINVLVREGIVLLQGRVQGRQAKKIAEYLIEDLPGVQEVRNELRYQHE